MIDYDQELSAFLSDEKQRVLMFEGPWGIGKSYYWRRFIERKRDQIKETRYAYVSLFGLANLHSLKGLLLTNTVDAGGAEKSSIFTNLRRRVGDLSNALKQIEIPWIRLKLETVLPNIEELLINNVLICLDDLERRNKGLEIDELLGFISRLREENDCRIVIICNTDELVKEDRQALARFREKVIDRHIVFTPLLRDNLALVFDKSSKTIFELFGKIGLNNIRVMQQTKWAIDYFEGPLKQSTETVRLSAIDQITRLSVVHYAFPSVINVEELGKRSWMTDLWQENGKDKSEASAKLSIVQKLGYAPSMLDAFIVDFLKNGFCDRVAATEVIKKLNIDNVIERGKQETYVLWELVYMNFAITEEEIVRRYESFIETYGETVYIWSICEFSLLLDQLEIPYQRSNVHELMARRIAKASFPEVEYLSRAGKWPSDLRELIKARKEEVASMPPIEKLVEKLSNQSGWNPEDFTQLDQYSVDELYSWMATARADDVIHSAGELIRRASMKDGGGSKTGVELKLTEVLKRLVASSRLNGFRVRKYIEKGDSEPSQN